MLYGPDFNNSGLLFRINFEGRITMSGFVTKKYDVAVALILTFVKNKVC